MRVEGKQPWHDMSLGLPGGPVQGQLSSHDSQEGYANVPANALQPSDMLGTAQDNVSESASMQRGVSTVQACNSIGQPQGISLQPQGSMPEAWDKRLEGQGSSLQAHINALQSRDAAVGLQQNVQQPQGRTVLPQSMVVQPQSYLQQLEGSQMHMALEPEGCLLLPQGSKVQPQIRAPELERRSAQSGGSMMQPCDRHAPHSSINTCSRKRKAGEGEVEEQDAKRRALSPDEPGANWKETVRSGTLPCDMDVDMVGLSQTSSSGVLTRSSGGLTGGSGGLTTRDGGLSGGGSGGVASMPNDIIRRSGDGSDNTGYNPSNGTGSGGQQ